MTRLAPLLSFIALVPSCAAPLAASAPAPATAAALRDELLRINDDIIEAIRTGNKSLIEPLLTADMVLINRDGKAYTRKDLVDDLVPPREGYDLGFQVKEARAFGGHGDTALLTYVLDEHLVIFGQDVSTSYRNQMLFRREGGAWRLALYSYWERPSTPPVVEVDGRTLDAVSGTYELAPGKWVTRIRSEGGALTYQRDGGKVRELRPMAGQRFYIPELEAEFFFERDAGGAVTALVFRRNWIDLRLRRVVQERTAGGTGSRADVNPSS